MHSIKRAFFWLSGAGTETLEQCPDWEQRKYVAFGATVLVPCAFAFIACAYALSTLTDNARVIYPVAAVWAFIILTIDRALLAGYRPYMSIFRKLSQFSLRLVVAILMGITIAHPLVLLLFRDTVSSVIEKDRAAEIEVVRTGFEAEKEKIRGQVDRARNGHRRATRRSGTSRFRPNSSFRKTRTPRPPSPASPPSSRPSSRPPSTKATAPFRERLAVIEAQSAELTPQYAKLQTELGFWQAEFERELNGQRSGLKGEGPRARSIRSDQLEPRREESKRLGGLLEHLTAEKATLQTQSREAEAAAIALFETKLAEIAATNKAEAERVAGLKQKVEDDQAGAVRHPAERAARHDQTTDRHPPRRAQPGAGRTRRRGHRGSRTASPPSAPSPAATSSPRRSPCTRLFKAGSQGGQFAFYTYIVLTLLFMLVDTIPLIVKFFTKPGPYDTLVDRDEITFDSEHRAFRQSRAPLHGPTCQRQPDRRHPQPAARTRARRWRRAHPRRPRVSRFTHRDGKILRRENEDRGSKSIGVAESDKRAALEAIKKRFYDDLHHRMEIFFTTRHA